MHNTTVIIAVCLHTKQCIAVVLYRAKPVTEPEARWHGERERAKPETEPVGGI